MHTTDHHYLLHSILTFYKKHHSATSYLFANVHSQISRINVPQSSPLLYIKISIRPTPFNTSYLIAAYNK